MPCLWALLLSAPGVSRAEKNPGGAAVEPKVVILTMSVCCPNEAWPEAEQKTATELRSLGLKVERVDGQAQGEAAQRAELGVVARRLRAACALRLVRSTGQGGAHVELWLKDLVTDKTLQRTLTVDARHPRAVSIVALRVVELLRASLLELNLRTARRRAPKPPKAVLDIARAVPAPIRRKRLRSRPDRFGVGVGGIAAGGPGGAGAHGMVGIWWRWTFHRFFSVELDGAVSVAGQNIEYRSAEASFHLAWTRVFLLWEILHRGRLRPSVGLGAGVTIVWVRGLGSERYVATRDAAPTADLSATGRLAVVLHEHLWLRVGFGVGLGVPEITVAYAGESAARFGLPYLWGSVGLEVRIP